MILQEIGHCRDDNGNSKRPPCKNNLNRVSSVCVMAVVAVTTVASLNSMSLLRSSSDTNQDLKKTSNQQKFYETTTFHQSGFGGIFNPTHEEGEKARRFLSKREVTIPKSAVKHAIPSLGRQNIENLAGHYYHDEHHSPFSSYLYDRPKEELIEEQKEYELKMVKVREEWGAWSFEDERNIVRPVANFDKIPYKDMNNNMFPENSWQTDEKYVRDFISQANSLVDRMIEGIYAEYGHPTKKSDGTKLTDQEIEERNALFKVHISDSPLHQGMSYINEKGMDALSRKLLHGMITNDEFYFVLGGHSAAAGHGNNFLQQKTMQFHYIMEPVFQKLGMRLISRNLAMGGLGTIHYSMGQAELYGEKDFLMWDSSMTEKNPGDIDMFNKQALINGERVPIIFTRNINALEEETNGSIWHGDIIPGVDFVPLTTSYEQVNTLPLATRYVNCDYSVKELCSDRGNPNKYDAHCWVPRSDYTPITTQSSAFGGQASWHPGNRVHQLESRKAAMTILQGLKKALGIWENGIDQNGFPLKESYWHVGETYKLVQDNLMTYMNDKGKGQSRCETHLQQDGLERACRIVMHGMGDFTPINLGYANSIRAHMKAPPDGWTKVPGSEKNTAYSGVDLLPLSWKIPQGEVDVHAIAIATTYARPQIDHKWYDEEEDEDAESSRLLRHDNSRKFYQLDQKNRRLSQSSEETIIPGRGWGVNPQKTNNDITGYCDGSTNSYDCQRSELSNCLLSGHNDGRNTISGDGYSGWLVIQIPKLKEGLIAAKIEYWHPRSNFWLTEGWREVNNGHRSLGGSVTPWPEDVLMDIAINGEIIDTWDLEKFEPKNKDIAYNENFIKFFDDENFITNKEGESVEFAFRIRSETNPRGAGISFTHLYYA